MPKENNAPELELEQTEVEEAPVSDDELLAAITEELNDEGEPEPKAEPQPEVDGEPGDQPPEQTADADGGKPEPEAKPEEATEDEPETSDADAGDSKPSDEFGELDKDVSEKTRERFDTLKSRYDEIVQERDSVRAEADKWVEAITGTGTNPEQFGMALTWLTKINSKKPEDLEDAYQIMNRELTALGKALGKPVNGSSPLDDYPDLKGKVDDGMLDEESALEIAQARASKKLSQASQQHTQQETTKQQTLQQAMDDVKQLGAELAKTDPDFKAKVPFLTPIIEAAVASGAPPDKWVSMIRHAVSKIQVPKAPAPVAKPTAPNPIRPGGTSPSSAPMQREPGNMEEAVNQALERGW